MDDCQLKVPLPGTFFRRNQRWWWRVRLPGEARVKSRSLRPEGEACGTKDRETAEALAFDLWQQALVADTEARIRLEARHQAQERARAYADLVGRLSTRAGRLVARQESAPRHPSPRPTSKSRPTPAQPTEGQTTPKRRPIPSPPHPILKIPSLDLETSIVKTARCDCCTTPFIPEVELCQIESGQSLCSKCMYYLRDAGQRQQTNPPSHRAG
jgi:hypothetical protein